MLETIEKIFYVGLYIRLSKEDDDSNSVENQKTLLTEYINKLGPEYIIVDTYIDDGFTGTNFDRPEFNRMVKDMEQNKINMIIVKDLSRFGREHIDADQYIEKWFPRNKIRLISILDNIDTFKKNNGNNDMIQIRTLFNEWYSRDISRKVRIALHTMQKQGKWVGGKTPFGYMKSPQDKNKLIICEEEAEIVKTIFNMAYQGKKIGEIKNFLNENNIPTASKIRYNGETFWENKAIKNILTNPVYIGTTIQNKRSRISYKVRNIIQNPKEEWNIVENTHEPIIEKEVFNAIQNMEISQRYMHNEKKYNFLLDGLLVCYECKHKIGIRFKEKGNYSMICNNYRRNSKLGLCTSHGFSYQHLEDTILEYIRDIFKKIETDKIELDIEKNKKRVDYNKMLEDLEREIENINKNIDKMYMDKLNEKISEERYERLYMELKNKERKKKEQYDEIMKEFKEPEQDDTELIKNVVQEFLKLDKPTAEIMRIIINRIEIHQDKQIDIIFNFKKLNYLENKKCLF